MTIRRGEDVNGAPHFRKRGTSGGDGDDHGAACRWLADVSDVHPQRDVRKADDQDDHADHPGRAREVGAWTWVLVAGKLGHGFLGAVVID